MAATEDKVLQQKPISFNTKQVSDAQWAKGSLKSPSKPGAGSKSSGKRMSK